MASAALGGAGWVVVVVVVELDVVVDEDVVVLELVVVGGGWFGKGGTSPAGNSKPRVSWPSLMAGGAPAMMAFTYMGRSTTIGVEASGSPSSPTEVTRRPKSMAAGK